MSIYKQATLGEPDNQITFNNFTQFPVYRTQTRAPQRYQLRQEDAPIPFEDGISDFQTLIGSTVYVIKGTMYPQNEVSYDAGLNALRAVCSLALEQSDPAADSEGYVPYIWNNALTQQQIFMKPMYVQLIEDTRQGFVQPFAIYAKVKDPIIYGGTLKTASTAASNPSTTTGTALYPFTYPVLYGSTTFTVSANAFNAGNIPAYPNAITINGPVNTPSITNTATGEYISVAVNLNSTSDILQINYGKNNLSVTLNGVNNLKNVVTGSTYFKLKPGNNVIQLSGASVGTGAAAVVNYYDSFAMA